MFECFPNYRAILIFTMGMALLFFGCQPKIRVEEPIPVIDLFTEAEKAFQENRLEQALMQFRRFRELSPTGPESGHALFGMAAIYFEKAGFEKTIILLKQFINKFSAHRDAPEAIYLLTRTHYRLGEYSQAEIEATRWLRLYPNNPLKNNILFHLGKIASAQKEFPKAFRWWLSAARASDRSKGKREEINQRILSIINSATLDDLKSMTTFASGTDYAPRLYHRIASIYIKENDLQKAKDAADALVRSSDNQKWVDIGKDLFERIKQELAVKKGVIGCLLPLSGPYAIYGQEVLNGMQLAMDIFHDSVENDQLELIIKDTGGTPEGAVEGLLELVNDRKVTAIVGPLASKSAIKAAQEAQSLGVPIITLTQNESITEEGEMVFRNFITPSKEIDKLLDRAFSQMSWSRFGILYPANSYGLFYMNLFWDGVEKRGGTVTAVEYYDPEETDFAVQIKKMAGLYYPRPLSVIEMLAAKKLAEMEYEEIETVDDLEEKPEEEEPEPIIDFDAVFIPDNYQQIALIAPQFPFYNIFEIPLMGTSLWQSTELIETTREYVQRAVFPSGFFQESDAQAVKNFVTIYQEHFEKDPGILAATGYDTIKFLKKVITSKEIKTRKDFQKGLLSHSLKNGLTGEIAFDSVGEVIKDPVLLTIKGRRMIAAEPTFPVAGN